MNLFFIAKKYILSPFSFYSTLYSKKIYSSLKSNVLPHHIKQICLLPELVTSYMSNKGI